MLIFWSEGRSVSSESAKPILGNECRKRTEPQGGSKRFATMPSTTNSEGGLRPPSKFGHTIGLNWRFILLFGVLS